MELRSTASNMGGSGSHRLIDKVIIMMHCGIKYLREEKSEIYGSCTSFNNKYFLVYCLYWTRIQRIQFRNFSISFSSFLKSNNVRLQLQYHYIIFFPHFLDYSSISLIAIYLLTMLDFIFMHKYEVHFL